MIVYRIYGESGPETTVYTDKTEADATAVDIGSFEEVEEVEAESISKQRCIIGRTVYDVDKEKDNAKIAEKARAKLNKRELAALGLA